jgi:hypothetical protein
MNQFMMNAIQQSGSDYSQKQNMMSNQFTSDQMLANKHKQVYNSAVAAAKSRVNTLLGSDYAETAYYGLDFAKKAYKQFQAAKEQVSAGGSQLSAKAAAPAAPAAAPEAPAPSEAAPATYDSAAGVGAAEPVYDRASGAAAAPSEAAPATYDSAAGVGAAEPVYDSGIGTRVPEEASTYDNIFGAGTPSEHMAADPQQAADAQEATSSLMSMESNPYDSAAGARMTSTDEPIYAVARAAPPPQQRVTSTDEPIYENAGQQQRVTSTDEPSYDNAGQQQRVASTDEPSYDNAAPTPATDKQPVDPADTPSPADPDAKPPVDPEADAGKSGFGDTVGLAGLGFGIYEEATGSDSSTTKAANIAGQVGLYAGVEAVAAINPVLGAAAGAAVGLGYLIDDLVTGKKREDQGPAPQAPAPPTMAFSSSAVLDSSAYRQPPGGVGQ